MPCFINVILEISKSHFFLAIFCLRFFFHFHYCARSQQALVNLNNLCVQFFRHVQGRDDFLSVSGICVFRASFWQN